MLPWGVLAALCVAAPTAALGDQPTTQEQVNQLNELAQEVHSLKAQLSQTQAQVATLEDKLSHYQNTATQPASSSANPATTTASAPNATRPNNQQVLHDIDAASQPYGSDLNGLDVLHFWGWLGFWTEPVHTGQTWWTGEFQLGATKTFTDRLAVAADINVFDSYNDDANVQVEQLFLSYLLSEKNQTLLTVGNVQRPLASSPRTSGSDSTARPACSSRPSPTISLASWSLSRWAIRGSR